MTDILELIDNAISDAYTSADAMRWTPELPAEPAAAGRVTISVYRQVFADGGPSAVRPPLTAEEAQAALDNLGRAMQPVVAGCRRMFEAMGRALAAWAVQVKPTCDYFAKVVREVEADRRVRARRMHTAYSARWRRR